MTPFPRRVVAIGGGTGLPNVLRGLRATIAAGGDPDRLTAVVTMTDDGGSSGRLRRSLGVPPLGDIRNCLVALAEEEGVLASLFQHRYEAAGELGGHSVGNLILAALAQQSGSFLRAIELSSHVLRTAGRILPSTLDNAALEAILDDGTRLRGESAIGRCGRRIRRVLLSPPGAKAAAGVIEAIHDADLVVIGPGSLFTSILPNVVVDGVARALRETPASVILVANLVSERGEAADLGLRDHVEVIQAHCGGPVLDAILVHEGTFDREMVARYREEGARPLSWDPVPGETLAVHRRNLVAPGPKLRHDPTATAEALLAAWAAIVPARSAR